MKKLKSYEIRKMWLEFWKSKGHDIIESSPLIPHNDPTLLWINAGVAPLKKYFDGTEIPRNRRIANAQKSIRTNDIENVGRTARHHTFFEMLGNFSIGDYFREEALEYAYEILTSKEYFDFDINKLYFTVYPTDIDTINRWLELGVPKDHIVPVEGNFWEIGEGPCGPDTEIFFDRGEKYDPENVGIRMIAEDINDERYIEIWNIVFSQFNAKKNVERSKYKELPSKNIDTGMGLERMACVMQEVKTNYETDLFMPIIDKCSEIVNVEYKGQMAFKVIADHVRSCVFALSDGATFSNEGRGYVLRRLLRRATRFGRTLGMNESFLYKLVKIVVDNMKNHYTYLTETEELVTKQIKIEEDKFLLTLATGEKRLLEFINSATDKIIDKATSFLLYDTFGFPFELTMEVASEHGFSVDEEGFKEMLQLQKERARNARTNQNSMNVQNADMMNFKKESLFVGYTKLQTTSTVIGLFKDAKSVEIGTGEVIGIFDESGFYAESGGQIGDVGSLSINNKNYQVTNTLKLPNGQHGLVIDMKDDELKVNDKVLLAVDDEFRNEVARNHSATHLLNESLRQVVGSHISQQGSLVSNNFLRFDFNNFNPLTNEEILEIEKLVNKQINASFNVEIKEMPIDEAKKMNVQAVFGEKYGSIVRVVNMDFSRELCGGTHVSNTGDIKKFAILSLETKGSGIFRIEAATANNILEELERTLENITKEINYYLDKIKVLVEEAKVNNIKIENHDYTISDEVESYQMVINRRSELEELKQIAKELEKTITKQIRENNTISIDQYLDLVKEINGKKVLIIKENNIELDIAKDLIDRLSDKLGEVVILLSLVNDNKLIFISKNKLENIEAGKIVKIAAMATNGNGGGRRDFAQAGGKNVELLDEAINQVEAYLGSNL